MNNIEIGKKNNSNNIDIDLYAKIMPILQQEIQKAIIEFVVQSQFQVAKIPDHHHTGIDSSQLNPADFLGFPIVGGIPVDPAINGTIRFYWDDVNYYMYVRINNDWKRFKTAP